MRNLRCRKRNPGAWEGWKGVHVRSRSQTQLLKARNLKEGRVGSFVQAARNSLVVLADRNLANRLILYK